MVGFLVAFIGDALCIALMLPKSSEFALGERSSQNRWIELNRFAEIRSWRCRS